MGLWCFTTYSEWAGFRGLLGLVVYFDGFDPSTKYLQQGTGSPFNIGDFQGETLLVWWVDEQIFEVGFVKNPSPSNQRMFPFQYIGNRLDILPGEAVCSPPLADRQSCIIAKEEGPAPKVEGWKKAGQGYSNWGRPCKMEVGGKTAASHPIQKEVKQGEEDKATEANGQKKSSNHDKGKVKGHPIWYDTS